MNNNTENNRDNTKLTYAHLLSKSSANFKVAGKRGHIILWASVFFIFSMLLWAHFAVLDEKEKAMDWLERAVGRGCNNYPLLAEQYPLLENIRGEPRFKKLLERVKHEWENFEV